MTHFNLLSAAIIIAGCGITAQAGNLWIIGDALPYGWSTDKATSLLSSPDNSDVYTGTVYLQAGKDFKFMTVPEWGNDEFGTAPGCVLTDGSVAIARGKDDTGYDKFQVPEDGNYLIRIDTGTLTASIGKSAYQESPVGLCSLYLVGDATPNGWDVMQGTPLQQNPASPLEFSASGLELKKGTFKIATALKGASSWNPEYWYFRNSSDESKIALNQEGDLQWNIAEDGPHTVAVNLGSKAISISKNSESGIDGITAGDETENVQYYTLTGIKVASPESGIYIRKQGSSVRKVMIK